MERIEQITSQILPLDGDAMAAARHRQNSLTKPAGALGRLEDISVHLAGIMRTPKPVINHRVILTMAADHGVTEEGISAYPKEVTVQMVYNFIRGGAGINVLTKKAGGRVVIVDVGVAGDFPPGIGIVDKKIRKGTSNMAKGPAMTRDEAIRSVLAGAEVVEREFARGLDVMGTGEMGIGNTTASSAIVAAITGKDIGQITGRGTGVNDMALNRKIDVIRHALDVNQPDSSDPLDVLAKVGGFEIGALAGAILATAAKQRVVLVDGFISGAGALIAAEICPGVKDYMIAAHSSVEIGHKVIHERLGLDPLLNLNLRLGEGTGAALAMPILDASLAILWEMATFDEAAVSGEKID